MTSGAEREIGQSGGRPSDSFLLPRQHPRR
jgi:hypothetical protein